MIWGGFLLEPQLLEKEVSWTVIARLLGASLGATKPQEIEAFTLVCGRVLSELGLFIGTSAEQGVVADFPR